MRRTRVADEESKHGGFVSEWVAKARALDGACPVLRAIAEATSGDALDEARLLAALRAASRPVSKDN